MKYGVHMSSFVIVVTPAEKELRELTSVDELPARVRADLEALCDEVSERFPEAEVITRPLVVNAVMRYAAPRQLRVTSPELGLVADPRERIDVDVHRRPTMVGAGIADHAVRGRPRGTLPWVTRELLGQLIGKLLIDGDRLELEVDGERCFRFERSGDCLLIQAKDGPDVPVCRRTVPVDAADAAADAGWAWARCDQGWAEFLPRDARTDEVIAPSAGGDPATGGRDSATAA